MIGEAELRHYQEQGYVVIPGALDAATMAALQARTDHYVESARGKLASDAVHDLEDSHRSDAPRVRRIKDPCSLDGLYYRVARHPAILAAATRLVGPDLRYHHSKINIKAAGYGAAIEWHQDWAFYPHTNDSVLAVGIAIDGCDLENGPLMVLPGSHRGLVHDHHVAGRFCGAIDPDASGLDFSRAVSLVAPAGSITLHHARLVHGSAANRSPRPRRLMFLGYAAADAWPLTDMADYDKFRAAMVAGEDTLTPRLEPVPVRLPYPKAANQGSIYENQRALPRPYFTRVKAG